MVKLLMENFANELEDTNPEQLDKIFDTFEDLGVDIKDSDDLDMEPDIDDLEEMENIKGRRCRSFPIWMGVI